MFMEKLSLFSKLSIIIPILCVSLYEMICTANAGQAILSWDPPTTNVDMTPLADLVGYKIYYGTSPGDYVFNIDVGKVTTYTISNLPEGITYYFATTAYDTSGNESGYSNEVHKTIQDITDTPTSVISDTCYTDTGNNVICGTTDAAPKHDLLLKKVTAPKVVNVRVGRRPARANITIQVQNLLKPKKEGSHTEDIQLSLSLSGSLPAGCSMTLPQGDTRTGSVRPRQTRSFRFKVEFQCQAGADLIEIPLSAEAVVVHVPSTEQELNPYNNIDSRSFTVRVRN